MIILNNNPLTINDVVAIARRNRFCRLDDSAVYQQQIQKGADFVEQLIQEDGEVYGVTTGYGDSCTTAIPAELVAELPQHLYTFHGCGMGEILPEEYGRAVILCRMVSLSKGYSGISFALLQQLDKLLQHDITPIIPQEGSVGASGDLTPLSYLAAVLCGERQVYYQGKIIATATAFQYAGISPLRLKPKEGLAIMNGTAVMTAIACFNFYRAAYIAKLATRITAIACIACDGNVYHYDQRLFELKPHVGQQRVAAWLREDLQAKTAPRNSNRLQDRYSLRCAPHVIGMLEDSLPWLQSLIENELNSSNDNPLIDAEQEHVLHGGHFYGGHIALAMDTLKSVVANIADLLDRQLAVIVDSRYNQGLPANLSAAPLARQPINHGFKAVQIGVSAWAAEALKLTMPASVFSRSTECHNQDKVSMGTIAARDCMRVLNLTEQICAALLLAVVQGLELRDKQNQCLSNCSTAILATVSELRELATPVIEDRALDEDLHRIVAAINRQVFTTYGES